MTTSTKATKATKATSNNTTVNPFLAALAAETAKLEKASTTKINNQVNKAVEQNAQLAEAACQTLNIELSESATEFYGLMVAAASTDGIAAASGAKLAESVQAMLTAYYAGNKEALAPVIDASNVWIATKAKGEVKTANIPNNLRLLVSRRSVLLAEELETDFKLLISAEGSKGEKAIVIKEAPLKPKATKTKAQKVFDAITKLDTMDRDELMRLVATDASLLSQLSTLTVMSESINQEVNKDTIAQLEARRNAAADLEDDLQDVLEEASEKKLAQADIVNDKQDALDDNEKLLTAKREEILKVETSLKRARKEETKAAKAEELIILNEQMEELLLTNSHLTDDLTAELKKLNKAQEALNTADETYNNQAHLVASIGKQLTEARETIAH